MGVLSRSLNALLALLLALPLVLTAALSARAEPLVRVRGESRIELGVAHVGPAISITGALRDELGGALSGRLLALEALPLEGGEPVRAQLTTDAEGRFAFELANPAHDYRLLAMFAGDATHRGVRVERRVERGRSDVRLELRLPFGHTIDLDAPELVVEAVAESDVGGHRVSMRLSDERGRELARGMTDRAGRLRVRVPTSRMGAPGAGLVRIESLRDERRAEAQTEARVVRRRAVFLELATRASEVEAGQSIALRGKAFTRVAPRSHVPVGLFAAERHLATVMTDARGEFETELWVDAPHGPLTITARTEGDATGSYPPAEATVELRVTPAKPVPFAWILLSVAALALIVWLSNRRRRLAALESEPEPRRLVEDAPSISTARAHGRRHRHAVSGRVIDARGERPVAGASVKVLRGSEVLCLLATDEAGRFESPTLPNGRSRLRIEAPGFLGTDIGFELPHRGEWSAVVIRLESLRARALAAFRSLALRALPSARVWGIWTTREARQWITEKVPHQRTTLRKLTSEVERACYARDVPSPAEVAAIEQDASAVAATLRAPEPRPTREERSPR